MVVQRAYNSVQFTLSTPSSNTLPKSTHYQHPLKIHPPPLLFCIYDRTESLYLRAADLLVLNETLLNSNTNAEGKRTDHIDIDRYILLLTINILQFEVYNLYTPCY